MSSPVRVMTPVPCMRAPAGWTPDSGSEVGRLTIRRPLAGFWAWLAFICASSIKSLCVMCVVQAVGAPVGLVPRGRPAVPLGSVFASPTALARLVALMVWAYVDLSVLWVLSLPSYC